MGNKANNKLNKQATSREGEVGRLQQRGQSSRCFLCPHQAHLLPQQTEHW